MRLLTPRVFFIANFFLTNFFVLTSLKRDSSGVFVCTKAADPNKCKANSMDGWETTEIANSDRAIVVPVTELTILG